MRDANEKARLEKSFEESGGPDASFEMPAEDRESCGLDDAQEEEEAKDQEKEEELLESPTKKRDFICQVFPFALNQAFYKKTFAGVTGDELLPHILVMSTSAHPSVILAGLSLKAKVHVLYDRVPKHSLNHGDQLLRQILLSRFMKEEKLKQKPDEKRIISEDLVFFPVNAPEDQPLKFGEVQPDYDTSGWRAGFNQYPAPTVLETGVLQLFQTELDREALEVRDFKNTKVLITQSKKAEGDSLGHVSCLLFGSSAHVSEFLNNAGNAALACSALFEVKGVLNFEDKPESLFAVPVGVARHIANASEIGRKHGNVGFRVNVSAGPNDGILEMYVSTHNGCGIAPGQSLCANYGAFSTNLFLFHHKMHTGE